MVLKLSDNTTTQRSLVILNDALSNARQPIQLLRLYTSFLLGIAEFVFIMALFLMMIKSDFLWTSLLT